MMFDQNLFEVQQSREVLLLCCWSINVGEKMKQTLTSQVEQHHQNCCQEQHLG